MNVKELREALEDYDDALEVRIAFQPSWPLRAVIDNIVGSDEIEQDEDEEPSEPVLWLAVDQVSASGLESPYAPRGAWAS